MRVEAEVGAPLVRRVAVLMDATRSNVRATRNARNGLDLAVPSRVAEGVGWHSED